jgi:hypothetical protein
VPASFDLTLDTRAPVVTWGAVGGATAGEMLTVLYSSDEPLDVARLWLPDGRRLDMTIEPDRLTLLLPADTPDGVSWIHAYDDVMNEAPRQAVNISGVIVVPPPEPPVTPGPPQRGQPSFHPDRVETRTRRSRSRGVARSRSSTTRAPRRVRSRSMINDSRSMIYRSRDLARSRATVVSSARSARYSDLHTRALGSSSAITRRREGPGEEDALALLDLL